MGTADIESKFLAQTFFIVNLRKYESLTKIILLRIIAVLSRSFCQCSVDRPSILFSHLSGTLGVFHLFKYELSLRGEQRILLICS